MSAACKADMEKRRMPAAHKNSCASITVLERAFWYVKKHGGKITSNDVADALGVSRRSMRDRMLALYRGGVVSKYGKTQGRGSATIYRYIPGAELKIRGKIASGKLIIDTVYEALVDIGGKGEKVDIAKATGLADHQVNAALTGLRKDGRVECTALGPSNYLWIVKGKADE